MIRYANSGDLGQIRDLWETCFPDETGFNEYFFENLFELEHVLLYVIEGRIAAMTQMIPREIRFASDRAECCTYIYGACTHPEYRRKHLMSKLLERSFVLDRSLGRKCSVLIPAERWLFDFYRSFGYRPVFDLHTAELTAEPQKCVLLSMLSGSDVPAMDTLYEGQFASALPHLTRSHLEWTKQIHMFQTIGLGCFGLHDVTGQLLGYAFAWRPEKGMVYAQEVAARSKDAKRMLLEAVSAFAGVRRIRYSDFSEPAEKIGCMKRYDDLDVPIAYMNLMMN